jgi:predicted RecA/RadA family phage recombinase
VTLVRETQTGDSGDSVAECLFNLPKLNQTKPKQNKTKKNPWISIARKKKKKNTGDQIIRTMSLKGYLIS